MSMYTINEKTGIDEFGIDHSNFSLRDELEYNMMRAKQSMPKQQNVVRQAVGVIKDMNRNCDEKQTRELISKLKKTFTFYANAIY